MQAQKDLDAKTETVQNLHNSLERLNLKLEEKTALAGQAQTSFQSVLHEAKVLKENIHSTQMERDSLTKSLEQRNEKLDQLEGELSQLSGTLKQRSQEISEKSSALKSKEKEIKTLTRQTTALQTKIDTLNNKFSSRNETLEQLHATISDYENMTQTHHADLSAEKMKSAALLSDLRHAQDMHEAQQQHTEQAILDYQSRDMEVRHLRVLLAREQRTVIKPALRNIRRMGGVALRAILPAAFVERLAFTMPTSEQKLILQTRARENITANIVPNIENVENIQETAKPDIFIFAIIGWHFRTQRPQHIARELSKLGHRVFYFEMDPPGASTEIEKLGHKLYRIKLKLDGVPQIPAYSGTPTPAQEKAWIKAFYGFCDEFGATPYKNLIVQHPFWWQLAKLLPPEYHTLYDCMDDIAGFANSDQKLIDLEHEFLENCDDLVVSGSTLMNKYKRYNPLQIIRNATEIDHFQNPDLSKLTSSATAQINPLVRITLQ